MAIYPLLGLLNNAMRFSLSMTTPQGAFVSIEFGQKMVLSETNLIVS